MALTGSTLKAYRRLRRENPTLSAKHALSWAKSLDKPLAFDWTVKSGQHANAAQTTRDGFDVRITVDYDQYADRRADYTDKDTGIRNPDYRYADGDGDYRYRNDPQHGLRYIEVESGYTVPDLAADYNKQGMSKSVALDVARKSLEDEAREYLSDMWTSYVVTVDVSLAGIKMGSASLGGIETGTDWSASFHDEREFESAIEDNSMIDEAIDNARESMSHLMAVAAKIGLDNVVTV